MGYLRKLTRAEWETLSAIGQEQVIGELSTASASLQSDIGKSYEGIREDFATVGKVKGLTDNSFLNTVMETVGVLQAMEEMPVRMADIVEHTKRMQQSIRANSVLVNGVRVYDIRALRWNPTWDAWRKVSHYLVLAHEYARIVGESEKVRIGDVPLRRISNKALYEEVKTDSRELEKDYIRLYNALLNVQSVSLISM